MNVNRILIPILLIGTCSGFQKPRTREPFINYPITEPPTLAITPSRPITDNAVGHSYNSCGYGKECVRNYLCNNRSVTKDGALIIDIRFGHKSCGFLETCCAVADIVSENVMVKPGETIAGCGFRNVNGVGFEIKGAVDNEAQFGEFPWMVAILRAYTIPKIRILLVYQCGGSLITPRVILSAAHCLTDIPVNILKVRAGDWETNTKNEPDQTRQVVEVILHEYFNHRKLYNDIALLFVDSPFELAPNVNTVCLPPRGFNFDFSQCYATGWGKDKFENGMYQNILKKIDLPVVPNAKCQENLRKTRLSKYFQLHPSFMCAGGERGKDLCKGDGGSPLVCPMSNEPNRFFQAGIVAWGIGCGGQNVPGVYANVPRLRVWIDQQLANRRISSTYFTP